MGSTRVDLASLQALLEAGLEGCAVSVDSDGYHVTVTAVGELFRGLRPVQRQQRVYAVIQHLITDGSLHAVNIDARPPTESA